MANHLETLTAEWLEFNGYFVRTSVLVGRREKGGYEGELDVVGFHPRTRHLVHIECSLDADTWAERERRFTGKFERGCRFIAGLFEGFEVVRTPDQVALLQLGGGERTTLGGGRIVWVPDLIAGIRADLSQRLPDRDAVPSTLPLLRAMQLACQPIRKRKLPGTLIPPTPAA